MTDDNVHGTALRLGSYGLLLRGCAQSGKSSLCLSLLRRASLVGLDALLVADDRVDLTVEDQAIYMAAPAILRGLIEVAGIGILEEPFAPSVRLDLVVDLLPVAEIPRLPEPGDTCVLLLGRSVDRIRVPERQAGFTADLLLTLIAARARTERG